MRDPKCVSVCGVRGTKGPKQRPSVDPELALLELPPDGTSVQSPSRKLNNGGRSPTRRNLPGSKKTKRKKTTKANKKKSKNGLVKREAFPKESNPSRLKNGKKKKERRKKNGKRKKARRKGKSRQGAEPDVSDVRTRQVWPWLVGSSCECNICPNQIMD